MNITKKYIAGLAAASMLASLATAGIAFAEENRGGPDNMGTGQLPNRGMMERDGIGNNGMRRPDVAGKVTAVSGTTLTVVSGGFLGRPMMDRSEHASSSPKVMATTTYSVDASAAVVIKNRATTTLSSVVVGDFVAIDGTVSGTSVTAKIIRDDIMPRSGMMGGKPGDRDLGIQGNGQPVIAGTVTAISGSSLTLTNTGSTTYTIDASNAVIRKGSATSTVSAIAVNDHIIVQGTINGTSIVATTVIDQPAGNRATDNNGDKPGKGPQGPRTGFFGSIGGFFKSLFGF